MARGTILRGKFTGRLGDDVFYVRDGEQIVRSYTPGNMMRDPKTVAQMEVRTKWANIISMYKSFNGTLTDCFETKKRGQSDYNRFVSMNMQSHPVYLTKSEVEQGACVAAGYNLSQGSLPEISVTGTTETAYTDIRLGDLVIDDKTTIEAFARAVVMNNVDYEYYDQVSYFSALQLTAQDGIPYVQGTQTRVNLNPTDSRLLLSLAPAYGFSTNEGFLGHGEFVGQGAFCWVHSRRSSNRVLVSSQHLVANNALLLEYTSQEARLRAMRSYGVKGYIFIKPNEQSGGSGDTEEVTVPPTVNIFKFDGATRNPGSECFPLEEELRIELTGNNLNQIKSLKLVYGDDPRTLGTQTKDVTLDENVSPTVCSGTVSLPAGSYCYGLLANDSRIISFTVYEERPGEL